MSACHDIASNTAAECRAIFDFPDYEVGNDGRVWSLKSGKRKRLKPGWAGRAGNRYSQVTLRRDGKSFNRKVHRLVLEAFVGPCPEGMEACHEDGNRADNNLTNLRWDTPKANHDDMTRHGTRARGARHGLAKLTEPAVIEIRRLRDEGWSMKAIGKQFGVTVGSISLVVLGRGWAHVAGRRAKPERVRGERIGCAKLKEADVREIRRLAGEGRSSREIATQYGVGRTTICGIVHRKEWRHVD